MRRLLLVDDEPNVLAALERGLRQRLHDVPMRVERATDPRRALELARTCAFDIVISDYRMPQLNGVEFLVEFKALQPDAVRLVLSAYADFNAVRRAINEAEAFRFITKPWELEELEEIVRLALARRDEMLEDRRLADVTRLVRGTLSPAEVEARRLEEADPGITRVRFAPDGSVLLED